MCNVKSDVEGNSAFMRVWKHWRNKSQVDSGKMSYLSSTVHSGQTTLCDLNKTLAVNFWLKHVHISDVDVLDKLFIYTSLGFNP